MHLAEASIGLGLHVKVQYLAFNATLVNPFVLLLQALLHAPLCLSVVYSCRTHRIKWSGQSWANAILWRTRVVPFDVPTFVSTIHNMSWLCCKLNGWIMLETCMDHAFSLNNYWELCMQLVWTMLKMSGNGVYSVMWNYFIANRSNWLPSCVWNEQIPWSVFNQQASR